MAMKGINKKEELILKKSPLEQYKYFLKELRMNIIQLIIAIPLFTGGAFLFMKIEPDKGWWFGMLLFLVIAISILTKDIIRISKIIKSLEKENSDLKE